LDPNHKKLAGKNITLDLGKFVPKLPVTVRITLMDANITGLLDIGEVLPLQPLCSIEPTPAICAVGDQNQTLRTALGLHTLGVDVLVSVEIIDDSTGDTKSYETIHAAIEIDKPTLNLDTTLGVAGWAFRCLFVFVRACLRLTFCSPIVCVVPLSTSKLLLALQSPCSTRSSSRKC
jgi:hypothetical protein